MTGRFAIYAMHGLLVRSEFPLPQPIVGGEAFDVEIRLGDQRNRVNHLPTGQTILEFSTEERTWYSASRTRDGYLLRFPDLCEFAISSDFRFVVCYPYEGMDPALIPILIGGAVVSLLLSLQGHHVLHASAVAIEGRAIAFAGASGMGKSTCAALLCAIGGRLVSDDVLRVQLDPPVCLRGSSTIRIRQGASSVVDMFDVRPGVGETPDGRLAVMPVPAEAESPLAVIVVPNPRRDRSLVEVELVTGVEAFWLLAQSCRLVGWQAADMKHQQFAQVAMLIGQVPVVRAHIPWGPPFPKSTAIDLVEALLPIFGKD